MDKEIFENGIVGARMKSGMISSGEHNAKGIRYFDENRLHPKGTSDAPKFIEFDWEILRRLLGETKDEASSSDFALLGDALSELLRWVVKGSDLKTMGRRAVALAWVVNPELLNGMPITTLARQFGFHRAGLSDDTAEVRRMFGIRNRAQAHAANWKADKGKPGLPGPRKTPAVEPGISGRSRGAGERKAV